VFTQKIIKSDKKEVFYMEKISHEKIAYSDNLAIKIVNFESKKETIVNLKISLQKGIAPLFSFNVDKSLIAFINKECIYIAKTTLLKSGNIKYLDILTKITFIEKPTVLKFSPDSRYLFVGNSENIVHQYHCKHSEILGEFALLTEYKKRTTGISALSFFDTELYIAGNRGDMVKVDIFSKISKKLFCNESVDITDVLLLSKNIAIATHANGELRYIDTKKMNVYKKIETLFTKINQVVLMHNEKYMLVCGREPYISLIDIQQQKNIVNKYISLEDEVKQMTLVSEYVLIVLLANNNIVRIDLPTPKQLKSLIVHGAFDEAYALVQKDPILLESQEYIHLEKKYQNMLERTIKEIPKQNKMYAMQTLSFFKNVNSKKKEINLLFKAFDNYKKFQDLFYEKEYARAYNLAGMYPALKSTREYKQMESEFKKDLQKASEYLKHCKYEQAQISLKKYMLVKEKQTIIKLFLNKSHIFVKHLNFLRGKEVSQMQALAQANEDFAECLKYLNIDTSNNLMTKNLVILDECINKGRLLQAKKIVHDLDTETTLEILSSYKEKILYMDQLYAMYEKKNYLACYNLLDSNDLLDRSDIVIQLDLFWKKMILKVEKYAYKGNVEIVSNFVNKYKSLYKREAKLQELLQLAYTCGTKPIN